MTDKTVIRCPTLAEAQREAQEVVAAASAKGQHFSTVSVGTVAGDTVITIYWRADDAE